MKGILTLLNLLARIAKEFHVEYQKRKSQKKHDAITFDPGGEFMRRFKRKKDTAKAKPRKLNGDR